MAKTIITQILLPICLLLSSASHATPISKDDDSISCAQWVLPVHAVADNLIFDTPHVDSSIDVANYVWYSDNWSTPNITVRTRSIFTVDQTWGINVKLCIPAASAGNKSETLQIATHGLGFDGRFVNPFPPWPYLWEYQLYHWYRIATDTNPHYL
jgi:hypothetical protein